MKVHKQETEAGVLELITFKREETETPEAFRQALKAWIAAKYPSLTWGQFIDRLVIWESDRIVVSMS